MFNKCLSSMYFEPDSVRYEEEGIVPTLTELTDSGKKWILTNNYAIRWTFLAGFLRKKKTRLIAWIPIST